MIKEKKKFIIECPNCYKEIIGFSEHHSKQNLIIHQKTSERCRDIKKIIKKHSNEKINIIKREDTKK